MLPQTKKKLQNPTTAGGAKNMESTAMVKTKRGRKRRRPKEEAKVMTRKRRCYYVPEELQREILLRLPVKSLLRFLHVNKRFRHLISTQQFITDHLKTFRCEEDFLILFRKGFSNNIPCYLFLDSVIPKHIDDIRVPYAIENYSTVRTIGYCNGVACLLHHNSCRYKDKVVFLNPSIRKVVAISALDHLGSNIRFERYGFGYVEDDYKLVVLPFTYGTRATPLTVKVFSLKTRNWETVACSWSQVPQHRYWKISLKRSVFLDGACYWLVDEYDNEYRQCAKFVLSFGLCGDHAIGEIVLPRILNNEYAVSIHVYKGCLSLVVQKRELWVMNKCGSHTSWTRIIERMDFCSIGTWRVSDLLGFTGGGSVLYQQWWLEDGCSFEELSCYNPTTDMSLKKYRVCEVSSPDGLYAYRQSLVLLDQEVQVPGEVS